MDIILVEEVVNNLDPILVSTREEEEGEWMVSNNKRRRVNGSSCSPTSTHLQTQILWEEKMAGTEDARTSFLKLWLIDSQLLSTKLKPQKEHVTCTKHRLHV